MSIPAKAIISLIRIYRRALSPILGAHCRFMPTCSEYFIEAVRVYGFWKGGAKGVWRILRCNPFGGSGYDPVVPKTKSEPTDE